MDKENKKFMQLAYL